MAEPAETIITWNAPNWITVLIMVTMGFFIIGSVSQLYLAWKGKQGPQALPNADVPAA